LKAAETAAPADLMIPTDGISVITAEPQQLAIEDARIAFKTWVLGNGLRDCVDAIGPTLEWARKHLFFGVCRVRLRQLMAGNSHYRRV
jgi:hypothetical protein